MVWVVLVLPVQVNRTSVGTVALATTAKDKINEKTNKITTNFLIMFLPSFRILKSSKYGLLFFMTPKKGYFFKVKTTS